MNWLFNWLLLAMQFFEGSGLIVKGETKLIKSPVGMSDQTKTHVLPAVQEARFVVTEDKEGSDGVDANGALSLSEVKLGEGKAANTD